MKVFIGLLLISFCVALANAAQAVERSDMKREGIDIKRNLQDGGAAKIDIDSKGGKEERNLRWIKVRGKWRRYGKVPPRYKRRSPKRSPKRSRRSPRSKGYSYKSKGYSYKSKGYSYKSKGYSYKSKGYSYKSPKSPKSPKFGTLYADIGSMDAEFDDIKGQIEVSKSNDRLDIYYNIEDGPSNCDDCVLAIYDGKRCKRGSLGTAHYRRSVNPWKKDQAVYVTDADGNAEGDFKLYTAYGLRSNACKLVLLFDGTGRGRRDAIGCGKLYPEGKDEDYC